jgi:hypothetical protein
VKRCGAVLALVGCAKSPAAVEPVVEEPKTVRFEARPPDAARCPPQPAIDCPSHIGIVGRIVGIENTGNSMKVTVAVGRTQRVEETWIATLQVSPRVTCPIDNVAAHETTFDCLATPDEIGEGTRLLLLCAP